MSSSIWYLYEFVRKKWFMRFTNAKSEKESFIPPERFRKIPVIFDLPEKCISCSACKESCPSDAISMEYNEEFKKEMPVFDAGSCINCGNCVESCPTNVLEMGTLRKEAKELLWNVPKIINLLIDEEVCVSCGTCENACPVDAISHNNTGLYEIDVNLCVSCKNCLKACPVENAIVTYSEPELSEKIEIAQNIKFDHERLGSDFKEKSDVIAEIPRIVPSLCIGCGNCVDVCPGSIDLERLKVTSCIKSGKCLEVCPTTAIRIGVTEKITKRTAECYIVDEKKCIGCRICYRACNVPEAILISKETNLPYINPEYCVRCGLCQNACPVDAIDYLKTETSENLYSKRKIRDEFESILHSDLEEFTKNYVLLKEEVKNLGKQSISEENIGEKRKDD